MTKAFAKEETQMFKEIYEKMFNDTSCQGNADQNHNGVAFHTLHPPPIPHPVRMTKTKTHSKTNDNDTIKKGEHLTWLVEVQISTVTVENTVELVYKTKNRLAV